jgi:enoyl-CoA hydratase
MTATDLRDARFRSIQLEQRDHVLIAALDRPPVNAVDAELHGELTTFVAMLKGRTDIRAVVLTGLGPTFCAGGDQGWFPELRETSHLNQLRLNAKQLVWEFLDIEIPIVAAVNGPAVGLGASLALLCDIVFMAESAWISDPHVLVGVAAGDGGTALWPLAIGPALAKEFLLTGDRLSAAAAQRLGLVNRVVPDLELRDRAFEFAQRLAAGAPLAIQATKMCVNKWVKQAIAANFDTATAMELFTFQSEDHLEAVAALKAKRTPQYNGR